MVKLFSPMRACALTRSAGVRLAICSMLAGAAPIEIDDAARRHEERLDAHDVVADVVDQLIVARRG